MIQRTKKLYIILDFSDGSDGIVRKRFIFAQLSNKSTTRGVLWAGSLFPSILHICQYAKNLKIMIHILAISLAKERTNVHFTTSGRIYYTDNLDEF